MKAIKKTLFVLSVIVTAVVMSSCATGPTMSAGNSYAGMDKEMTFHTREFMKKQPLAVPDGIDEDRLGVLPFAIGIEQSKNSDSTYERLSREDFKQLSTELETIISASNRFPLSQAYYGLADSEIRQVSEMGVVKIDELDYDEMETAKYLINIRVRMGKREYAQKGRDGIETFKMFLNCMPVVAKSNKPLAWLPSVLVDARKEIKQRVTSAGIVSQGLDTSIRDVRSGIQVELFRKGLVKVIDHIYTKIPAGGKVTDFDLQSKAATVKASRSTGLLANMQMVIYARAKGNSDAMRVALFNADLATCGQTGTSELTIWREAKTDRAKRIIAMIAKDWEAAQEKYDFYAASDGIAEIPDFIEINKNVN